MIADVSGDLLSNCLYIDMNIIYKSLKILHDITFNFYLQGF